MKFIYNINMGFKLNKIITLASSLMLLNSLISCRKTSYTITWRNYDGTILETDNEVKANKIPQYDGATPTRPSTKKYNYEFNGWLPKVEAATKDQEYFASYDRINITYTVNFDVPTETEKRTPQIINAEEHVIEPKDPTVPEDYKSILKFSGWYKDKKWTDKWDFKNDIVEKNMTLYAGYEVTTDNYVPVIFKFDKVGTKYFFTVGEKGKKIEHTPDIPKVTGYTFKNWMHEKEEFNLESDIIPSNFSENVFFIEAKWDVNKHTVTWSNDDGTQLEIDNNVAYGTHPTYDSTEPVSTKEPPKDVSKFYKFSGWKDVDGNEYNDKYYMPDKNVTFTAQYKEADHSFENDSWSTVIENANQGISHLHEVYKKDCGSNIKYPGSLVGLEKEITINGITHKVRVIDEAYDTLTDSTGKATLTFEFSTLISDSTGIAIFKKWSDDNNNVWSQSDIRKFMWDIKNLLPDEIKKAIKSVEKETYDSSSKTCITYSEELFPLCVMEMGYYDEETVKEMVDTYKYYKDAVGQLEEIRSKKSPKGSPSENYYWLRSTNDTSHLNAWYCDNRGLLDYHKGVMTYAAVAPAFCIGVTTPY